MGCVGICMGLMRFRVCRYIWGINERSLRRYMMGGGVEM